MSLLEALRRAARERPNDPAFLFLANGEAEAAAWTFGELDRRARAVAVRLRALEGERVLLLFPPGLEFLAGFLGCLYAGAVAVPAYPPQSSRAFPRLRRIVADALPGALLTQSSFRERLRAAKLEIPELDALPEWATDEIAESAEGGESLSPDSWRMPGIAEGDLALLQYTSGSTALPKGVMVSHGNLLSNAEAIRRAFGQSASSVVVSWLPPYHDMGLIGGLLQPLYVGARCVLMSPMAFLQQPVRWLRAISRYRGTTSGGPNFAFDLCAQKISESERADLDLSSWSVAFNGAEPVRAETLDRFEAAFAPSGFSRRSFIPCYGLAEATLFVAGGLIESEPRVASVESEGIARGEAAELPAGHPEARTFVSCGGVGHGERLRVVDPETGLDAPPGRIGEILVEGSSVTRGYWGRPEAPEFSDGALRTGDLGFLSGGELFVTGRLKDLVIVRGRNHYPQDLELTAERSHPALRLGGGAAFSIEVLGEERVVLVHEVARHPGAPLSEVAAALSGAVAEEHELKVHEVVLISAGTLPKTPSGKVQRALCRELYLADGLDVAARTGAAAEAPAASDGGEERGSALWPELREMVARHTGLAVERIVPPEPLVRFGLDSLAAVELQAGIERRWGVSVPLGSLLSGAGLAEIGAEIAAGLEAIAAREGGEASGAFGAIKAGIGTGSGLEGAEDGEDWPLSEGQEALWVLHHLAAGTSAYHISAAARAVPPLDAATLDRALRKLSLRHAALRATFDVRDGVPVQRFDGERLELLEIDALGLSEADLKARLLEESRRPFDLAAGPLLRIALLRVSPAEDRLVLSIHHLVADFWSVALIARELSELYAAECEGREADLPLPVLSYADFVAWERRRMAGEEGERLWGFWRGRLSGTLPVLDLPTDRHRPPAQTFVGGSISRDLGPALLRQAAEAAETSGATLSSTLLSAFFVLLHRYARQSDLLVGMPTAGRRRPELSGLVGYFVNPVAVRANLSVAPDFSALLAEVHRSAVAAVEHGDYPFPLLAARLQPERDPSRSPLFQTMFQLVGAARFEEPALAAFALRQGGQRMRFGGHVLESLAWPDPSSQFDLALRTGEVGGSLVAALQYNSDLFDASTAERMLGHFEVLLTSAVGHGALAVSDLPLLTAAERRQLAEWNATAADYGRDVCLDELIAEQVARTPEEIAVEAEEGSLTYRELLRCADRLAARLQALGVGPESRVGVCLERSLDLMVALLGILRAGGAYVPLDPAYPADRLAYMIANSAPQVVLAQAQLLPALPAGGARVLVLDGEEPKPADVPPARPPGTEPENLAYAIYTSGSTGRPKGAMNAHAGIVNRLLWMQEAYALTPEDRVLQKTPASFDVSVWEFFWPLLVGARLVMARPGGHQDPEYLAATIAARRITTLHFVPSMLQAFLDLPDLERCLGLKRVIASGEALPYELERRFHESLPGVELHNLYGPTEAAVDVTFWACEADGARRGVPIGRPVANTRIHLLERSLSEVPVGVAGELHIGGVQVGRGYLGRPELTAERFIPDPFAVGGRLYKTGDLARRDPDGVIEFLGRIDHQVKIRGFRIELGEIEEALDGHAAVREAVVVAEVRSGRGRRLVAYLVAAEGSAPPTPEELRHFLGERLPDYMVPGAFVMLSALPLLPNGKVDRAALPAAADEGEAFVPPRTPTEEIVAAVLAEALEVPRVGAADGFFRLGGHSLLAVRAAARLQSLFGRPVSMEQILRSPTVAELAAQIDGDAAVGRSALPPLVTVSPRPLPVPMSFAQERLWFLARLEPESPAYHMAAAVELVGDLSPAALSAAVGEVVARHEMLRTAFDRVAGQPAMLISEPSGADLGHPIWPIPLTDLSGLPASRRAIEAPRLVEQEARRPFALSRGPLQRLALLRTGEREHRLALTLHHIASDGWSMGVFAREISAAYAAYGAGVQPALPRLPIQYADFALWQRSWLSGGELERQLAYWRGHLEGAPAELDLPTDRGRPAMRGFRGGERSVRFAPELAAALAALGRREGTTLFMTLFSAAAALLARWSGRQDLVLGAPVANRSSSEVENLIGLFANTLALRVPIGDESDFRSLLSVVRQTALGAYAHQDVPLEKLVEDLRIARSPGRSPLFQVLVGFWKAPLEELELPGVSARRIDLAVGAAKFDLTIRFEPDATGLLVQAEYAADLFDRSTVARLLGRLEILLAEALAAPERRLSELATMGRPELHQVLREWNDTARPVLPGGLDAPATVHEAFERQAARRGDALAVEAGGTRLSWKELSRRSSRLARDLHRLGLGLESRVGLLLPRSVEQIVALLGVQKAGGAFVPLDPAAPRERIEAILAEAGISAVVTAEALRGALPEGVAAVIPSSADDDAVVREPDPLPAVGPENLAYILYTSGSTGRPKGVMIEHRSVLGLLAALRETVYRGAGSDLLVAMNAPLTFDASVKQWVQLLDGHAVHVVPDDVRVDAARMLEALEAARVEVLDCTPGQLGYLLAAGLLHRPGSLRRVLVGGEELPRAEWSVLAASERPAFWNVYGPTECTVDATAADLRSADARPVLGRPIPGVRVHQLDPAGRPAAPGAPGEICIGGGGVARGYLGRPDQTAERFVPDPWGAPGERMYRTGDLARRLTDGTIEFLGRIDHQVKVNGFRIELGEIEAVLSEHPGVRAAAVLLSANELGEPQLAAFVEPESEPAPNAGDLRTHLKRRLPAYMIPAAFAAVARMPQTRNGKIDRPALLALPREAEERAESSLPETALEKVLAGMVAEVLGLERVGRHDNFFELGGHSMRAIELVASLREAFGIDLPLFHVFDAPTVAGLAGVLLDSSEWRETVEELAPALLDPAEPVGAGEG